MRRRHLSPHRGLRFLAGRVFLEGVMNATMRNAAPIELHDPRRKELESRCRTVVSDEPGAFGAYGYAGAENHIVTSGGIKSSSETWHP